MNTSRIFWGTLWIVAGGLILLTKLDLLSLPIGSIWRLWPLVLVLWGVGILVGGKAVRALLAVLAAILVALIIFGAWQEWGWWEHMPRELTSQTFMETYDTTVHRASLRFASGAGTFTIRDTCDALFRAETETDYGKYAVTSREGNSSKSVTLSLEDHVSGFRAGGRNRVDMRMRPGPLWAVNLEVGAAKLDADLSPFAVDDVDIRTGAADVRLTLGTKAEESRVHIQAGVSSIAVHVPESAGCEIRSESGLTSKTFEGFESHGGGVYRTSNFAGAPHKIFLTFKAGVSSLRVVRDQG